MLDINIVFSSYNIGHAFQTFIPSFIFSISFVKGVVACHYFGLKSENLRILNYKTFLPFIFYLFIPVMFLLS